MLTPYTLKSVKQAEHYYDMDDYWAKGESPSQWCGDLASEFGLRGEIDREDFVEIINGRMPDGTEISGNKKTNKRPGTDLIFSAPKSVSLACFLGDEERIKKAHEEATRATLKWAEKNCAYARVTSNKVTSSVQTDNLCIAAYQHETSRELDPLLHTHCVVGNVTRCPDGKLRALDNQHFYQNKMLMGAMYRVELAERLQKLGYEVEVKKADGTFEIKGFTEKQLQEFSTRSVQIKEAAEHLKKRIQGLKDRDELPFDILKRFSSTERALLRMQLGTKGEFDYKAKTLVSKYSRKPKMAYDRQRLSDLWRSRASELGIDFKIPKGKGRTNGVFRHQEAMKWVELAVKHHSERTAVVTKTDILRFALERGTGKLTVAHVDAAIDKLKKDTTHNYRLRDLGDGRYTTEKAAGYERRCIAVARNGRGKFGQILDQAEVSSRLEKINQSLRKKSKDPKAGLTEGQWAAVETICTSKDRVVAVQGYAGTGKTFSLETVRKFAEEQGYKVRGFAPITSAAKLLQKDAGIESDTISKLLVTKPEPSKKPQLWIIDESSMIGNKQGARLLARAERENARVIMVGDREQIPAVEAGKPFAQLMQRGEVKVAIVDQIMRQKNKALKGAVLEVIKGQDKQMRDVKALEMLKDSVFQIKNRHNRLRRVATEYLKDPENRMVITGRNEDRRNLNEIIRQGMETRGTLKGARVESEILKNKAPTRAELKDTKTYELGDTIVFSKSYRSLGVGTGDRGNVLSVDPQRNVVQLEVNGRLVDWRPWQNSKVNVFTKEKRDLRVGDRIRWTKGDRENDRTNGQHVRIAEVNAKTKTAQYYELDDKGRELKEKGLQTLDLSKDKHWEYGYVSTIFSAQGQTVKDVLVHVDTKRDRQVLGHEAWYVAISRAKEKALIYSDSVKELPNAIKRSMVQESALEAWEKRIQALREKQEKKSKGLGWAFQV